MENIILMGTLLVAPLFLHLRKPKNTVQNRSCIRPASLPMLLAYLGVMGFVLALTPAMNISLTSQAQRVCLPGFIMGLVYFGFLTNLRGALFSGILLPFMTMVSIFAISLGEYPPLYLLGKGFFACCQGGFFILLPKIIPIFLGESRFKASYALIAPLVGGFMVLSYYIAAKAVLTAEAMEELYTALIILSCIAALFLFIAWQRRYYLVIDNKR